MKNKTLNDNKEFCDKIMPVLLTSDRKEVEKEFASECDFYEYFNSVGNIKQNRIAIKIPKFFIDCSNKEQFHVSFIKKEGFQLHKAFENKDNIIFDSRGIVYPLRYMNNGNIIGCTWLEEQVLNIVRTIDSED